MKKILSLLLIAVLCFTVLASCKKKGTGSDETTTKPDSSSSQSESTTVSETTTEDHSNTTTADPGQSSVGGDIDTEDAEEVNYEYLVEDDNQSAITTRRTGSFEFVFKLDGELYGQTIGLSYPIYDWVVDVVDASGNTTRIELGMDVDFITDETKGIIKAYFGVESAGGFIPKKGDTYTVKIYALEDGVCVYYGSCDAKAKVGQTSEGVEREPQYLDWKLYAKPFEDHHTTEPHFGKVVYVIVVTVEDTTVFSGAKILETFDLIMFVDGQEYKIEEINGWNTGADSVGLRIGVEAAGFIPEAKGKVYNIRFELRAKGTDTIVFELEEAEIVSNYPIGITEDDNRQEPLSKMYDPTKITVLSGPEGHSATEGSAYVFDDDIKTKLCTPDIQTTPLTFTTETGIKLASISLVTANDNVQYGGRIPTGFKLEASTDGTTWTTLLDRPSVTFEDLDDWKEYNFAVERKNTAYTHFRLSFTGSGTIQFAEIQLFQQ